MRAEDRGRGAQGQRAEASMNPIVFALRHPITMIMLVVALVGGGALALARMRIDIFPPINESSIYVFTNYGGYDPFQMEGLLVSPFELWFQFVDGVRSMESRSIQQVAVVKLSFYPDTDMSKAMAQVVSVASRAQATQPDGTLPPLIMQMDAGNVPVGYLVFRTQTRSLGEIGDLAMYRVRPLLQTYVPGTVSHRAVRLVHPRHHRQRRSRQAALLQPHARGRGERRQSRERHQPFGQPLRPGDMPLVPNNAMVREPKNFGSIPVKPGRNVYVRDVATVADATDLNYGYALVDGRKSVYVPVVKKSTASTLQVVSDIKKAMPVFKSVLPEDVDISFEFDESPTVVTAVNNVATEGLIGAVLTGLMILVFLRDWRSVIVVVFNIPMALLGLAVRPVADGQHDQHHDARAGWPWPSASWSMRRPWRSRTSTSRWRGRRRSPGRSLNGNHDHRGAAAPGAVVHPVGVHPRLHHGRAGAVAVRAAVAGGRLRHDLVVSSLQHHRAGAVGVAAETPRSS